MLACVLRYTLKTKRECFNVFAGGYEFKENSVNFIVPGESRMHHVYYLTLHNLFLEIFTSNNHSAPNEN